MHRRALQLVAAFMLLLGALLSSPPSAEAAGCTCSCRLASFCQGPDGWTTCSDYRQTYC